MHSVTGLQPTFQ